MKFAFVRDNQNTFDIDTMCRVLGVTPAGFYAWFNRPESPRAVRARALCEQVRRVHHDVDGIYGSIKVTRELRRRDHHANRKTIAKLMKRMGLRSKVVKKFRVQTTDSDHTSPIAPNTLDQNFAAANVPNKIWAADITYIRTEEGFLYLAGVMDLCSRKIVGWSMKDSLATELVEAAFDMALQSRKPSSALLHHSDRGTQYASAGYREKLAVADVEMSMSRSGNCYDNAVIESFWGKLKTEMVNHRRFATKEQARVAIFEYIEMFYNRKRLHAALGYVSPVEFESRFVG
jgi:transposase InsO family protein